MVPQDGQLNGNPASDERWHNLWSDSLLPGSIGSIGSIEEKASTPSLPFRAPPVSFRPLPNPSLFSLPEKSALMWSGCEKSAVDHPEKSAPLTATPCLVKRPGPRLTSSHPRLNPNPMSGRTDWLLVRGKKDKNYSTITELSLLGRHSLTSQFAGRSNQGISIYRGGGR